MQHQQFKEIRTDILKITQQALANEMGLSSNSIARMERGELPIEKRTILALRWIVYHECGITFEIQEAQERELEVANTQESPSTPLDISSYLVPHGFDDEMIKESLDKLTLIANEFAVDDAQKHDFSIFVLENYPMDCLNIRKLRRHADDYSLNKGL